MKKDYIVAEFLELMQNATEENYRELRLIGIKYIRVLEREVEKVGREKAKQALEDIAAISDLLRKKADEHINPMG